MKIYPTGATRLIAKFVFYKKIGEDTRWFKRVIFQQRLHIVYHVRPIDTFGEIAPTPSKVWKDEHFI